MTLDIRRARREDVPAIVTLLADDAVSVARGITAEVVDGHFEAFDALDADPNQLLWVLTENDEIIGTQQLTFIPGISRHGAWRAQIEAVRISSMRRGAGLGAFFIEAAVEEARKRGCALVQLTSDTRRTDAHRFYERLGFTKSHAGFKLAL
ncbi:GNAT family N-acetyltransferase [Fodinicola feengrottensis]|uniref:GNAT family N-acetyltransferase n=1 Tax=Fodinicola feengrottensis TaxID=435914 RepID=A0ABN2IPI3_9ACTN|nr:GNAT family N-acetyltransferase [Fodinicola feengrottensis]